MATVYLARDLRHDRLVALKLLRPAPVAGGPAVTGRGNYVQVWHRDQMGDGSSPANCGTALLRQ